MACTERALQRKHRKPAGRCCFLPCNHALGRTVAQGVTESPLCSESWVAAAPSPAFPRQEDMMRPQSPRAVQCHLVRRERQVLVVRR